MVLQNKYKLINSFWMVLKMSNASKFATQIISDVSFITTHVAYTRTNHHDN